MRNLGYWPTASSNSCPQSDKASGPVISIILGARVLLSGPARPIQPVTAATPSLASSPRKHNIPSASEASNAGRDIRVQLFRSVSCSGWQAGCLSQACPPYPAIVVRERKDLPGQCAQAPASVRKQRLLPHRAGHPSEAYLRAAQAYMLISIPTDTSTIFGVFQAI